jgi:hypothetical protein
MKLYPDSEDGTSPTELQTQYEEFIASYRLLMETIGQAEDEAGLRNPSNEFVRSCFRAA